MTSQGIYERDNVVLSHFKKKQVPITTIGGDTENHQEVAQLTALFSSCEVSVFCLAAVLKGANN